MRAAFVLCCVLLAGCGGGTAADPPAPADAGSDGSAAQNSGSSDAEYFPMVQGATWTYRASTWTEPGTWETTVAIAGTTQVAGRQAWVFQEDKGCNGLEQTYLAKDDRTVTFFGESPGCDVKMDRVPWQLMRFDAPLDLAPLLVANQIPGIDPAGQDKPWDMVVTGQAADETVTVPAGTFQAKRFSYSFVGTIQGTWGNAVELRSSLTQWRARGIGVVKESYADGVQFASKNWIKELERYSIPGR